jgi:hypothetical protein
VNQYRGGLAHKICGKLGHLEVERSHFRHWLAPNFINRYGRAVAADERIAHLQVIGSDPSAAASEEPVIQRGGDRFTANNYMAQSVRCSSKDLQNLTLSH